MALKTVITGTGAYIPPVSKSNADFESTTFYQADKSEITAPGNVVVRKFEAITGIRERRYVTEDLNASDIAAKAAEEAIANAEIDRETIDQLIVAHNFGDVKHGTIQTDILPSLASRVKNLLGIENPACVPYDVLFGCPGWVQGVIHAEAFIKSGMAKRCLVIGAETLSRVLDPNDRDSMIFSDGAGATIVEGVETDEDTGILSHGVVAHTKNEAYYLFLGEGNAPDSDPNVRYIKMLGRKIYEYALNEVPAAMKKCLDDSGHHISEVKKVFIHQANEKMDEAIIKRLFEMYDSEAPEGIMPMSIHELGNSSVATVPTLYHRAITGQLPDHTLNKGDLVIFASVGAGMNVNAITYRI